MQLANKRKLREIVNGIKFSARLESFKLSIYAPELPIKKRGEIVPNFEFELLMACVTLNIKN